jgi:hypothetical protein
MTAATMTEARDKGVSEDAIIDRMVAASGTDAWSRNLWVKMAASIYAHPDLTGALAKATAIDACLTKGWYKDGK